MNWLVSINFENMRFLGSQSAGEGPHLVPISLKIGFPLGPHFVKLGSPWHVATVNLLKVPKNSGFTESGWVSLLGIASHKLVTLLDR